MRKDYHFLLRVVGVTAFLGVALVSSSPAICYSTARIATDALAANYSSPLKPTDDGYQVSKIVLDPVLGQKWAMVSRCGRPDWPVIAIPANGASTFAAMPPTKGLRTIPLVRAGDIVRLWKQESVLRFEASGIAEGSGDLGATIQVRLTHKDTYPQSAPQQFDGIIRGHADVEMLP